MRVSDRSFRLVAVVWAALCCVGCGTGGLWGQSLSKTGGIPPGEAMTTSERGIAQSAFERVNQEREAEGLPPLTWHEEAADVAYDHCIDMRVRGYVSHYTPEGKDAWARLALRDVEFSYCTENIGHGHQTSEGVVNAFMISPAHRANVLRAELTHLGVGVHMGNGGPWWTLKFLTQ